MKILLIGNCQVGSLANILTAANAELRCEAREVWQMSEEEIAAVDPNAYDVVIAQPLMGERYHGLTHKRLCADHGDMPLLFIHNLYFEGTLPDCAYVGPMSQRLGGAMGSYHSSIVLEAFLADVSVAECINRLNTGTGIDARAVWARSVATLRNREDIVTIPFVDELIEFTQVQSCFHVFNHPTAFLLERYAEKILAAITGQASVTLDTNQPDMLAIAGTWPTYAWVADALELTYSDNEYLIPKLSKASLTLEEFVNRSFATYGRATRAKLVV